MTTSLLAEWDNFYVITGSSAAGLTGLTFVVIALSADAKRVNETGLRAFVTPTIVHFGAVLALAAYLSMPHQTVLSLSLGLGAAGAAGILYVAVIAAVSVLLMFIGIHNAWDVAVWNSVRKQNDSTKA
jgi:hypothetical protein